MQPRSVEQRVTMLEEQMRELRELPARVAGVELQILQLRGEMHEAFSATRSEFNGTLDGLGAQLRTEMHGIRDELRGEMHGIRDELRTEIRTGDEATRTFMRVLHEEVLARIATLGEGRTRRTR